MSSAHPDAGVADPQPHVAARLQARRAARRSASSTVMFVGVDGQRAAVGHRVAGVDREVDQDLLELAGVGHDRPQVARPGWCQRDVLAEGAAQQLLDVGDDAVEVEHLRLGTTSRRAKASSWRVRPAARSPAARSARGRRAACVQAGSSGGRRFDLGGGQPA